ncbi:hypothetical protein PG991_001874 [Apiospora marii]|uniref:Uncharacterized protein n=1 Tax=Apiospora marii TaxID=335849 RepID=A0ABR1SNA0_9PEZI
MPLRHGDTTLPPRLGWKEEECAIRGRTRCDPGDHEPDPMRTGISPSQHGGLARCPRRGLAVVWFRGEQSHTSDARGGAFMRFGGFWGRVRYALPSALPWRRWGPAATHNPASRYTPAGQIRERPHRPHGIGSLGLLSNMYAAQLRAIAACPNRIPLDRLDSGLDGHGRIGMSFNSWMRLTSMCGTTGRGRGSRPPLMLV